MFRGVWAAAHLSNSGFAFVFSALNYATSQGGILVHRGTESDKLPFLLFVCIMELQLLIADLMQTKEYALLKDTEFLSQYRGHWDDRI